MKKILYIDCFSGISGDMMLGAFLGLGVEFSYLKKELAKLDLPGYSLGYKNLKAGGISAFKFDVVVEDEETPRNFRDIRKMIAGSSLDSKVKDTSIAIFETLASAEAKVHGLTVDTVHFHEVGAVDSIIDIVGAAICFHKLEIGHVSSSKVPLGSGFVDTAHGRLPVPAPATTEILKGVPVYKGDFDFEVTTPTGAAFIKTLASGFGKMPSMIIEDVGYGAGSKPFSSSIDNDEGMESKSQDDCGDLHNHMAHDDSSNKDSRKFYPAIPDILRLLMGRAAHENAGVPYKDEAGSSNTILISANIDDSTPEILGYVLEKVRDQKVLDAWIENIYMKKNRPAFKLCVLCERMSGDSVCRIIFEETTTLGIRREDVSRYCLERKTGRALLPYGEVEVKIGIYKGKAVSYSPEYETCRALAGKTGKPLKEIYRDAVLFFSRR
ncbi:MAG: LarC family nickel insertion protein [Actinobacteria bacterium]|nr:LarC family nickel insertion protein [Actinomycetota bacterium]